MDDKDLQALYEKRQEKYMLVNVLSRRVRRLVDGEKPAVSSLPGPQDYSNIAIEELKQGKLKVRPRKHRGKLVDIAKDQD